MNTSISNTHYKWINMALSANNADELRSFLQEHYPALHRDSLKKIAIFGAGPEGERLISICHKLSIDVELICDDNPSKQGCDLLGHPISTSDSLASLDRSVPIIVASHRCLGPIKQVKALGFVTAAPFSALQTLFPNEFTPHMFYDRWFESIVDSKSQIASLFELLEDELSRKTLDAIFNFRFTFDPLALEPIIDWNVYSPEGIIEFSDDEVYVDGGTFDGDSIRMFIDRTHGRFNKIYGFEPDTNTFKDLVRNFKDEPRVVPVNKGLYSDERILYFDNAGTRASIFSEEPEGNLALPVVDLDSVLNGERVTYIKMNIEGAEIPALNGSAKAIEQWKPKLAISIYHFPKDLWEIPALVKSLHSDYKLYLRQQDGGVIEGVLYAL